MCAILLYLRLLSRLFYAVSLCAIFDCFRVSVCHFGLILNFVNILYNVMIVLCLVFSGCWKILFLHSKVSIFHFGLLFTGE